MAMVKAIKFVQADRLACERSKVTDADRVQQIFIRFDFGFGGEFNKRNKPCEEVSKGELGTAFQFFGVGNGNVRGSGTLSHDWLKAGPKIRGAVGGVEIKAER